MRALLLAVPLTLLLLVSCSEDCPPAPKGSEYFNNCKGAVHRDGTAPADYWPRVCVYGRGAIHLAELPGGEAWDIADSNGVVSVRIVNADDGTDTGDWLSMDYANREADYYVHSTRNVHRQAFKLMMSTVRWECSGEPRYRPAPTPIAHGHPTPAGAVCPEGYEHAGRAFTWFGEPDDQKRTEELRAEALSHECGELVE